MVEPTRFSVKLNVGYKENRGVKNDSKIFVLSNWKDGIVVYTDNKDCWRRRVWERISEVHFRYICLRS